MYGYGVDDENVPPEGASMTRRIQSELVIRIDNARYGVCVDGWCLNT